MGKLERFKKLIKSLRFRLIITFLAIGILTPFILQYSMLTSYMKKAVSDRTIDILSQTKLLANQMVNYDYIHDTSSEVISSQIDQISNIYDGRVILVDDSFHIVKDTYNLDEGKTIISEEVVKSFRGEEICNYDFGNRYIELTVPVNKPDRQKAEGVILVSVSTDSILAGRTYMRRNAFVLQCAFIIIVLAVAIRLSDVYTKPLRKVVEKLSGVQAGYIQANVEVGGYSEVEDITQEANRMLARMKVLDDSRQEFVSNVSHELKTPLTSMKVLADSLTGQEEVPVELYKEFMSDIAAEIERENKIINDLLSLVKMDKTEATLNIETVSVNDLLELIMKRLQPIAKQQNVDLVLESFRPVSAEVDEVKLTLAITNLVENAIKYNKPEGWVHVSLNADHQYFYVKVEDSGIGIPEESLEYIYERFYRVDKSHSREIGGTGLGLAITRNAVLMHRGAIKAYSEEGKGTTFNVRIPLNYIA